MPGSLRQGTPAHTGHNQINNIKAVVHYTYIIQANINSAHPHLLPRQLNSQMYH